LAIINIHQEKQKLVQGRQGIEATGRLSSRCPWIHGTWKSL